MNVLVISEKNDAAQRIASILSGYKYTKKVANRVPIFSFHKDDDRFTVVGLRGHILQLDYPREFSRWDQRQIRELIWVEPIRRPTARAIVSALEVLATEAEEVVIATDFDREGELIGAEALGIILKANGKLRVKRARFSAFTKDEVDGAFNNLAEMDFNLAKSAESRQLIDLAWGAVLTRFLSMATHQYGRDFLSVGRVQSPTLALIVSREREITIFVPVPFWEIVADLKDGSGFKARHERGVFWEKADVEAVFSKVRDATEGTVAEVKVESRSERPPTPFNTTIFLTEATRMGISAPNAMAIAEKLYTSGFISYPRTDNTVYPKSLNLNGVLKELTKSSLGKEAERLLGERRQYPTQGKVQATDHPPIYPVAAATEKQLKGDPWKVYELVVRRFFATLAPDAQAESTEARVSIKGEPFKAHGHKTLALGWYSYYPYYKPRDAAIPALKAGQAVKVASIGIAEDRTKPPRRFSQGDIIQEMERLGLGTKSTRHEIIQKLYDRRYVEGSPLRPTVSGAAVVRALEDGAEQITKPEMTALLEREMTGIADGQKEIAVVVKESQEILDKAVTALESKVEVIRNDVVEALRQQKRIGICPRCGRDLVVRTSRNRKRFVGCAGYPACDNTYPLPQVGLLVTTEKSCAKCKAPVIKLVTKGRRPRMICINMDCVENEKFRQRVQRKPAVGKTA
jgi:DNA topoisomerase-1